MNIEIRAYDTDVKSYDNKIEGLNNDIKSYDNKIENLNNYIKSLNNDIRSLIEKIEKEKLKGNDSDAEQIRKWNDQIKDWKELISDWKDQIKDWKETITDWKDQIKDWKDKIKKLEKQRDFLVHERDVGLVPRIPRLSVDNGGLDGGKSLEFLSIQGSQSQPMLGLPSNSGSTSGSTSPAKLVRSKRSLDVSSTLRPKELFSDGESIKDAKKRGALQLESVLIEPENFSVLYALCQVYTIDGQSHEDSEKDFAHAVVEILLERDSLMPFLQYAVTREVDDCNEPNVLFRSRTVFTFLLSDVFSRKPCVVFLGECIEPTISKIINKKGGWEIELSRVQPGPKLQSGNLFASFSSNLINSYFRIRENVVRDKKRKDID